MRESEKEKEKERERERKKRQTDRERERRETRDERREEKRRESQVMPATHLKVLERAQPSRRLDRLLGIAPSEDVHAVALHDRKQIRIVVGPSQVPHVLRAGQYALDGEEGGRWFGELLAIQTIRR